MTAVAHHEVSGPYFEDLTIGRVFDEAPAVTITDGIAAAHHAIAGDHLRLPLSAPLCTAVTGSLRPLANPMLVCNLAIGQSTAPSQRVIGNLFYRGLVLRRPVHVGDTLRTRTEVVAARQNRRRPDRPPTGTVVLRVTTTDEEGRTVLDFCRAPLLPLRDASADTGRDDDLEAAWRDVDRAAVRAAVPAGWDLGHLRAAMATDLPGITTGTVVETGYGDTVSAATELVRLTLNRARTHRDPDAGAYGRRLVYGGHTIALAFAHATLALPGVVTMLAWHGCDHTGPVFEADVLRSRVSVEDVDPLDTGSIAHLRVVTSASRGPNAPGSVPDGAVLDWRLAVLMV